MSMNITLIGMSGVGKTHIGKRIARHLDLEFLDLDDAMEEKYGKPLSAILEEIGDEGFVEAESSLSRERTHGRDNLLISTGGSIIYADEAMEHLMNISTVVYLTAPYDVIWSRLGGSPERLGRIVRLGQMSLRELYDARLPLYEKYAHLSVDTTSLSMDDILATISSHHHLTA